MAPAASRPVEHRLASSADTEVWLFNVRSQWRIQPVDATSGMTAIHWEKVVLRTHNFRSKVRLAQPYTSRSMNGAGGHRCKHS